MLPPAPDEHFLLGALRLVLHIPGSRTLKDRRRVVRSFVDRVRARHDAAVAEVGHLEDVSRVVIGVSVAGNDRRVLQARLEAIAGDADRLPDAVLVDRAFDIHPFYGERTAALPPR